MRDAARLAKALNAVGATEIQTRMAAILLAVNGLDDALAFVEKIPTFTDAPAPIFPPAEAAEDAEPLGGYRVCGVCGADIAFDPLAMHACANCGEPLCLTCAVQHSYCTACDPATTGAPAGRRNTEQDHAATPVPEPAAGLLARQQRASRSRRPGPRVQ